MTGLLYLIIIGMWAAVLFPIFLKKYDQSQTNKSVGLKHEIKSWHWQPKPEETPRQQAFVRRRRVVMGLLTAIIGTFLASMSGVLPIYIAVVPVVLLALFVYVAISQGHKITQTPVQAPIFAMSQTVANSQQETVVVAVDRLYETIEQETAGNTWQPVEPPLPAYVKAARASDIPRGIDATKPWTGQDMVEHAAKLRTEHAQRIKQAQKRLEEARAISMEKARRAALSARPVQSVTSESDTKKVVNE